MSEKRKTSKPKVKVEWTKSNGICSGDGWEIILPEGYAFSIQMDDCCGAVVNCRPYCIKVVKEKVE